jgi:hypothetical protein
MNASYSGSRSRFILSDISHYAADQMGAWTAEIQSMPKGLLPVSPRHKIEIEKALAFSYRNLGLASASPMMDLLARVSCLPYCPLINQYDTHVHRPFIGGETMAIGPPRRALLSERAAILSCRATPARAAKIRSGPGLKDARFVTASQPSVTWYFQMFEAGWQPRVSASPFTTRGRWHGYNPREPLVIALRTLPHITSGSTQEDCAAQTRADLHARARFQSFAFSCGHGLKGQHTEWRVSIHAPKDSLTIRVPFAAR